MSRRGLGLLLLLGLIWGVPYFFIHIAVQTFAPATLVLLRVVLAASVLLPVVVVRGQWRGLARHWRWIVVFAVVEMGIAWMAINWAQTSITSSLTALIIAAVPTVAAVMSRVLGLDDRLTGLRLVGLALGFVGVGLLVGLDIAGSTLVAAMAVMLAAICYATGPIIADRRLSEAPTLAVIAAAMLVNAAIFAVPGVAQWPDGPIPLSAWISVAVLGLVCSALAFIVFFALIAEVGPARTTIITYLNPVVAVALGVVVLGEPVTSGLVVGFPLILVGSWLATRRAPARESEPAPV